MANKQTQLTWIQKNRGPRADRARPASTLVLEFARVLGERHANVLQPVAEAVGEIVDRRFCEQCRLLDVQGGVLRFGVKEANLVPIMRMKWSEPIRSAFAARRSHPPLKVREVRFEFSTGGLSIPSPEQEKKATK
ncbi:MAG: hypothetical protein HY287_08315 [Planctomycetes bacterium]|nr:hypothetical protein [Planctomycetota bacterium]MBI3834318.1 hypothetical protein [Planctomycetota bacterium]